MLWPVAALIGEMKIGGGRFDDPPPAGWRVIGCDDYRYRVRGNKGITGWLVIFA